jgi:hypothetical protein
VTIVFKDLQKLVSAQQRESTRKELFQRLQSKPFWIWNVEQHKQDPTADNQRELSFPSLQNIGFVN